MDKDPKEGQPLRNEEDNSTLNTGHRGDAGGVPDLDGDGLIGNTGGFYGGTSYLGSNFGPDWDGRETGEEAGGNYGAAGAKDEDEA